MPIPPGGAYVATRTKRDINRFIKAEAFTENSARTPEELGVRSGLLFNRLVNAGVFIGTSRNRYFLHRENLAVYQRNKRKRLLIILLIIFAVTAIIALTSN